MIKSNKHIEIVRSATKGLSSMSQISCDAVFAVLAKHFTSVRISTINDLSDLKALVVRGPDLVFLGMEFIPANPAIGIADPDKIWLSDFFDAHDIAYTGSGQSAHELQRDKPQAKQRLLDSKLSTSAFQVIKQNQLFTSDDISLTFPLFVKPTNRGGGMGIDSASVVHDFDQLQTKVSKLTTKFKTDSLIEEYLPGREFSVAILNDEDSSKFNVMPIELIAPVDVHGARLLSSQVKASNNEQVLPVIDEPTRTRVNKLAIDAFNALGARDYGRIDIRLNADGMPHFLEANLIPSLISGYGSFPKACALNIGLEYEPMILRIARLGMARINNVIDDVLDTETIDASVFLSPDRRSLYSKFFY
jgi:D-alanine-D-alanine ligase